MRVCVPPIGNWDALQQRGSTTAALCEPCTLGGGCMALAEELAKLAALKLSCRPLEASARSRLKHPLGVAFPQSSARQDGESAAGVSRRLTFRRGSRPVRPLGVSIERRPSVGNFGSARRRTTVCSLAQPPAREASNWRRMGGRMTANWRANDRAHPFVPLLVCRSRR